MTEIATPIILCHERKQQHSIWNFPLTGEWQCSDCPMFMTAEEIAEARKSEANFVAAFHKSADRARQGLTR